MDSLVIRNVRVIDGTGAAPAEQATVVVTAGRIAAAGPAGQVTVPAGDHRVIDGTGMTLLPGLMDLHVHLAMLTFAELQGGVTDDAVAASVLRGVRNCADAVRAGVTTVRDAGCRHTGIFSLRRAAEDGTIPGPRIFLCGTAMCTTGGHAPVVAVEADGEVEVRKAARAQMKLGAEWVKLMVTGGTATPGEETTDVQFTAAELGAAVDEAHRRGKRAMAHVSCLAGTHAALAAGFDTLEHGIELDEQAVAMMRAGSVFLCSTLCLTHREAMSTDADGIPEWVRRKAQSAAGKQFRSFGLAHMGGAAIAAGTDADGFYHPFGRSMVWELEWLVKAGMSPLEAIHAATGASARLLGRDDLGTVAPGKWADLLLVRGNPAEQVTDLHQVRLVTIGGKVVHSAHA